MSKTEENIFLAIKILLFVAPFSLLLVCPGNFCPFNLFFPYITGKAIFFRIIIEIALLLMVLLLISNRQFLPKKGEFLFWISIFFLIAIFVINLFSLRPYLSFFGNAERSEGVWALLHFLIWFWLLWIVFKIDPSFKKAIFYSFLIVLYIISFIEIQQGLILQEIRPSSTLGNATYVGFFGNLMLFLCLYFLYQANKQEKFFIFFGIFLALTSIIISQTRGAILGISAGLFIFGLYYFLFSKIRLQTKILVLIFVIIAIFGFYQFLLTDYALKIPGINRVAESLRNPASYMARLIAWQIFLDAWKEKPIFGYGLENSPIAYFKAFDSRIFNYEEVIFDRPHNKYIEILVTNGIAGALVWLIFYLTIFYTIFKNERNNYLRASLLGFFVGYLVQNFTLFDVQASYLPLFFGLALLSPPLLNYKKEKIAEQHIMAIQILVGGLVVIGLIINIYNFYIVRGIVLGLSSQFPSGLNIFADLARRNSQFLPEIALMTNRYLESNITNIKSFEPIQTAFEIYFRAFSLDPYDTRVFNSIQLMLMKILLAKKELGLDYSNEQKLLEEMFANYLREYPKVLDIKFQYIEYLRIIGEEDKAYNYLKSLKEEALRNQRYAFMFLFNLYNFNHKEAYDFYKEIISYNYKPRNQLDYILAMKITNQYDKNLFNNLKNEYLEKFNSEESKNLLKAELGLDNLE
jgi:O-antigen ligase